MGIETSTEWMNTKYEKAREYIFSLNEMMRELSDETNIYYITDMNELPEWIAVLAFMNPNRRLHFLTPEEFKENHDFTGEYFFMSGVGDELVEEISQVVPLYLNNGRLCVYVPLDSAAAHVWR